ncbi:MAG: thiamine biosynthesis lipoprotein [Planctomycetota bacterium]|jgi:thiamine biosynthesis lipoprotein
MLLLTNIALILPTCMVAAPQSQTVCKPVQIERQLSAMGTSLFIRLEAPTRAEALAASELAAQAIDGVEAMLSTWRQDSELSLLNRSEAGEPFELSLNLAHDLSRAFEWRSRTHGAFDPTVGALVELWDLRGLGKQPSASDLRLGLLASGTKAFDLQSPTTIVRRVANARIEEGGFGKGAGIDVALANLRAAGIKRAEVDLGGQVALLACTEAQTFEIAHPLHRDQALLALNLFKGSIATSGNSERSLQVEGKTIGHLLDPRTGEPATDFGSVTVWSESAFDADCLSTALFVLGPDAAMEFAASCQSIEAIVIDIRSACTSVRATSGLRQQLTTLDPSMVIEWIPGSTLAGSELATSPPK